MINDSKAIKLEKRGILESRRLNSVLPLEGARTSISEGMIASLVYPRFLFLGAERALGIFEYNVARIRAALFPEWEDVFTSERVRRIMDLYEAQGLIIRYRDSQGRELAALTNYRGWHNSRVGKPLYEEPPGVYHTKTQWNIPDPNYQRPAGEVEQSVPRAPVVEDPKPGKRVRNAKGVKAVSDTEETRGIVDFYREVWQAKRVGHTAANLLAVSRPLRGGEWDAQTVKAVLFLARHGRHGWYREHNHTLEYLTRPATLERIVQQNDSFRLTGDAASEARRVGVFDTLIQMGFRGVAPEAPALPKAVREFKVTYSPEREAAAKALEEALKGGGDEW